MSPKRYSEINFIRHAKNITFENQSLSKIYELYNHKEPKIIEKKSSEINII